MKEAPARTSRVIARIREYGIETYQGVYWLFKENETELDAINEKTRELERIVSDRKE